MNINMNMTIQIFLPNMNLVTRKRNTNVTDNLSKQN